MSRPALWPQLLELLDDIADLDALELYGQPCPLCEPRGGATHDADCVIARAVALRAQIDGDPNALRELAAAPADVAPAEVA